MIQRLPCCVLLWLCSLLGGCAGTPSPSPSSSPPAETATKPPSSTQPVRGSNDTAYGIGVAAQLFDNMGPFGRVVTTDSRLAQRYFDQGIKWMYGFNHDEAVRSFTKAAELDPSCAMAWWGVAYSQGPNYNASSLNAARQQASWDATQKAVAALDNETPVERALVHALLQRYEEPSQGNQDKKTKSEGSDKSKKRSQTQCRADFAKAMAKLYEQYPDDPEVATLYADAMMVMHPWRLWKSDGTPERKQTQTIIDVLEATMAKWPDHPGANHLYIHAVEASPDKMRGVPAADRLSPAVPASGHLTHMPSHLYVQVGMWDKAVKQNILAMQADKVYLERSPMQFRQHGYIIHNAHMLAFAAMMTGQEELAMRGARAAWDIPEAVFNTMGKRYDRSMCSKLEVMRRFGRWDAILAEPAPPKVLSQTTAVWRACRAIAFAAKKDFTNARSEHAAFKVLLEERSKDKFLLLNDRFIAAEIALQQDKWDDAVTLLKEAIGYEDQMRYGEPPRWIQPVRHTLGAVLVKAKRFAEAQKVYEQDLKKWPNNGWSLLGLARSLEAQGKADEAQLVMTRFNQAWGKADKPLATSCKCIPSLTAKAE